MGVLATTRPPFLVLAPICVALGVASAIASEAEVAWWLLGLVVIGALVAHMLVNVLNELHDFASGLDLVTERTPFSGGSGTLPAEPEKQGQARILAMVLMAMLILLGLALVYLRGVPMLLIGLLGVGVILLYSGWINRRPFPCLVAPGVGFGLLMVPGTELALTGELSREGWLLALFPFLVVNNLLLLNQFPDREADMTVGRRHFVITRGRDRAARLFALQMGAAYLAIALSLVAGLLPVGAALVFLLLPLAGWVARQGMARAEEGEALVPVLGANVAHTLASILLLAVGVGLSGPISGLFS